MMKWEGERERGREREADNVRGVTDTREGTV